MSSVGAYTRMLAGRVARVSLLFCVCVLRGFILFCRLRQSTEDPVCDSSSLQPAFSGGFCGAGPLALFAVIGAFVPPQSASQ
ncbi:unnamed protein product [Eruca vesicaria subsp. sativa]|uniref:Secreted protein n=1 Tax=Eruca vesicaria subsp. sativa TaxID=29727 RepID=A0ABC8JQG3_ERUVS|nr:unnamed protein product [Eruca vesicaria subsp. sativa]